MMRPVSIALIALACCGPGVRQVGYYEYEQGDSECSWDALDGTLDDWAQSHSENWEGQKEEHYPRRRVFVVAIIPHTNLNVQNATDVYVSFSFRQRSEFHQMEFALIGLPSTEAKPVVSQYALPDLWTALRDACRIALRSVEPSEILAAAQETGPRRW